MTPEEEIAAAHILERLFWGAIKAGLGTERAMTVAREVWAEQILIRAFRNILDQREYVDTLGSKRGQVLAERLARAAVAMLKERKLLVKGDADEVAVGQSGVADP